MSTTSRPGSIVLISRLAKAIIRAADEQALGMKYKAYAGLTLLRDAAQTQKDMCTAMHLDPNNCVLLLNDMEAAGHVRRVRDPDDRRRHIVELTPAGKKALAHAERAMEDLEEEVLGALSPDERAQFRDLLERAVSGTPAAAQPA
jgi:MarR family transcriptional regulator, temperature-dependent positive regulator of motility